MQKQLKTYFKGIKKNLPCLNSAMCKMLDDLRLSVDTYIKDNNIVDFKKVIEHFGTAEDIAKEFAIGIDNACVKSYKFKKRVVAIVIFVLVVIAIVVSSLSIYIIISNENNRPVEHDNTIIYNSSEE